MPRVENNLVPRGKKERNYLNFRQAAKTGEHTLLKKMVKKELKSEEQELTDLAERVGFLDPNRACKQSGTNVFSETDSLFSARRSSSPNIHKRNRKGNRRNSGRTVTEVSERSDKYKSSHKRSAMASETSSFGSRGLSSSTNKYSNRRSDARNSIQENLAKNGKRR